VRNSRRNFTEFLTSVTAVWLLQTSDRRPRVRRIQTSTFWRDSTPCGERKTRLWLRSDQFISRIAGEMTLSIIGKVFLRTRHVAVGGRHELRTSLHCIHTTHWLILYLSAAIFKMAYEYILPNFREGEHVTK